jgi:transcriptional regulator with XRE-family HTH domain
MKPNVFNNNSRSPSPLDERIGANLRRIRMMKQISQEQLAVKLGITFQQIQKYEKGANKISLARAIELVDVLDTELCFLTDGVDPGRGPQIWPTSTHKGEISEICDRIQNKKHLSAIRKLALALADPS